MEYVLLVFVLSVFVIWFRARFMMKSDWFIVIKYTHQDYLGEQVDAHFVQNSADALYRTSLGPMRPGEKLRGFWIQNDDQRIAAIRLHDKRAKENRDFELLMEHIDEQWMKAAERARH